MHTFDRGGRHLICGRLKGGFWDGKIDGGYESLRLGRTYFLPSSDESAEFVLVLIDEFSVGGSSDSSGFGQVWELKSESLRVVQQIDFNTHFGGLKKYASFDPGKKVLMVEASHYLPGDAHCCISAYDSLHFQWTGSDFELFRKETRLTEYGRRN